MLNPQRDTTEYKNLALWKEDGKWVIRKGTYRIGCYIDQLTRKDLKELYKLIHYELHEKYW